MNDPDPLDLEPIRQRDMSAIPRMRPPDPPADWATNPSARAYAAYRERAWFDAEWDRRALLSELDSRTRERDALQAKVELVEALAHAVRGEAS